MLKNNTLYKVKQNIDAGELGMARQQLHTLVNLFPYDLSLRRRLGDVYFQLRYPERAGCYWFLEEQKTEVMERACVTFVRSCGGHSFVMLRTLKFRGGPESLPPGYARSVLEELSAGAPDYKYPAIKAAQIAAKKTDTLMARITHKLIPMGCMLFAIIIFSIFATGLVTIYRAAHEYVN